MKEDIIEYCSVDIGIEDMFLEDIYDKALLGVSYDISDGFCPAYDLDKIIEVLMGSNDITYPEALNVFNLNILDAYPMISFVKITDESINSLSEYNNEMLFLNDYDPNCLLGVRIKKDHKIVSIYDDWLCVQSLMNRDSMGEEDAIEYFEYNTRGAYVGENTPAFLTLL